MDAAEDGANLRDVGHDVAMREHDGLRLARAAAGEEEPGFLAVADLGDFSLRRSMPSGMSRAHSHQRFSVDLGKLLISSAMSMRFSIQGNRRSFPPRRAW